MDHGQGEDNWLKSNLLGFKEMDGMWRSSTMEARELKETAADENEMEEKDETENEKGNGL